MRIRPLLLPLCLAAVLAGCAAPAPGGVDPVETATPTPEGFSIAELVEQLPVIDGQLLVTVGDVKAARELAGLDRPTGTGEALLDWVTATAGFQEGSAISLPWPESLGSLQVATHDDYVDALGFGIPHVDAFLEAAAPPSNFAVLDGRFDPAVVTAAMGEPRDGMWTQPGDELVPDLGGDHSADALGRPVVVAGDESRLVRSLERRLVVAYLEGDTGASGVLAAAADLLDAEGAYAAMISTDGAELRAVALLPDGDGSSTPVAIVMGTGSDGPETGAAEGPFTVTAVEERGEAVLIRFDGGGAPPAAAWRLLQTRSALLD